MGNAIKNKNLWNEFILFAAVIGQREAKRTLGSWSTRNIPLT
jgi:hypothetical protein